MGNRAVITTIQNYNNNGIGVYLHWFGGRDAVEAFLEYMKLKKHRTPETDNYGWARLCQVIGNFLGGTVSIGIDTVNHLDTNNGDNGVYIIRGWDIVSRKNFYGTEQDVHSLNDMLKAIDKCQPVAEQLGDEFFAATPTPTEELLVGDEVFIIGCSGKPEKYTVVGYGEVDGIPYVDMYTTQNGDAEWNINNYLREKSYRVNNRGKFDMTN